MVVMIILGFVFLTGISLGVVLTLIALSNRHTIAEHPSSDPPLVKDSSNPYEPSRVSVVRPPQSSNGCAIAITILGIVGISLLTFAVLIFFVRTNTIKSVPPVIRPASPPASAV